MITYDNGFNFFWVNVKILYKILKIFKVILCLIFLVKLNIKNILWNFDFKLKIKFIKKFQNNIFYNINFISKIKK